MSWWDDAVAQYLVALRAGGAREQTIGLRRSQLARIGRGVGVGPWDVTGEQLVAWLGERDWSPETRRSHRSALRAFFRWALETGRRRDDPSGCLARVKPAAPRPRPTPEVVYRDALARADERLALALRLGAEMGLRVGEMVLVHRRDVVPDLTGWSLVVHGKGGKDRVIPMPASLARAVLAACEANGTGWAFPGRVDGHLTSHSLGVIVSRAMPEGVTAHTLRHKAGTDAHRQARGDLLVVKALLGHASVATTERYVATDDAVLRAVVEALAA